MNPTTKIEGSPRKKGGRPPLPAADRQEKGVTVRLTSARHAQLQQQAVQEKRPLAEVIRRLVEAAPTPITTRLPDSIIRELDTVSETLQNLAAQAEHEGVYELVWEFRECSQRINGFLDTMRYI